MALYRNTMAVSYLKLNFEEYWILPVLFAVFDKFTLLYWLPRNSTNGFVLFGCKENLFCHSISIFFHELSEIQIIVL